MLEIEAGFSPPQSFLTTHEELADKFRGSMGGMIGRW